MTDRDRLIELLEDTAHENGGMPSFSDIADHLLANGVIVPQQSIFAKVYEIKFNKKTETHFTRLYAGKLEIMVSKKADVV